MTRRFFFALLIAFVLPLAQVAAAAHELSHVRVQQDKSAPVAAHCDVCAIAAAVTGGGAASEAPVLVLHAPAPVAQPLWAQSAPATNESPSPFQSRAPPSLR
jgi:hypothetical protein